MTQDELEYDAWLCDVEDEFLELSSSTLDECLEDLPGIPLRAWYDNDVQPDAAALRAIRFAQTH
ncbi:MAG: hypothetical protein Q8Q44_19610 [Nocardioides sp.]|nr:hypothetical protein [Nocardioides sp.]